MSTLQKIAGYTADLSGASKALELYRTAQNKLRVQPASAVTAKAVKPEVENTILEASLNDFAQQQLPTSLATLSRLNLESNLPRVAQQAAIAQRASSNIPLATQATYAPFVARLALSA